MGNQGRNMSKASWPIVKSGLEINSHINWRSERIVPFFIEQFIKDRKKPITVQINDPATEAVRIMQENDFSQVPVVDNDGKVRGMVTNESIIRSANIFKANLNELFVRDVYQKAKKFQIDQEIFDLLNELKSSYAVVVVDSNDKLLDVFTSYDALEFFRQRFDDFMMVEDIEGMIKELILNVFRDKSGNIPNKQQEALDELIKKFDFQRIIMKPNLYKAISKYLEATGDQKKVKKALLESILEEILYSDSNMNFSDLGYDHYSKILLSDEIWERYEKDVRLNKQAVQNLLDQARDSRNVLAHFKGELTPQERNQLEFCKSWLNRQMESIEVEEEVREEISLPEDEIFPTEEEYLGIEGKYSLLFEWFRSIPVEKDRIRITFNKFEDIIGSDLPESARIHRAWWANDSVAHSHSILWLEAGWRTSYINLSEESVVFARIEDREKAYIDFFNNQLNELREFKEFPLKEYNPDGQNWLVVSQVLPDGVRFASYNYSFARGGRYRIELYIDCGDQEKNKQIFTSINKRKIEIEEDFGQSLSWERMDDRRASRVAFYQEGKITETDELLRHLAKESARLMKQFYISTIDYLLHGFEALN
jgi:hypothetical protein